LIIIAGKTGRREESLSVLPTYRQNSPATQGNFPKEKSKSEIEKDDFEIRLEVDHNCREDGKAGRITFRLPVFPANAFFKTGSK
jgi:hypothetical protein